MRNRNLYSLMLASLAGLLFAALPARACYSGLIIIPTAETVGAGQYAVDFETGGQIPDTRADTFILNSEIGIGNRLEAGVDYDFSTGADPQWLFNAKYVAPVTEKTAVGVGVTGIGNHLKPTPYLVTTTEFPMCRGHLGVMQIDGNTRWFAGVDHDMNDTVSLCADYTSGDANVAALGANYAVNEHLSVFAAVEFPNDHSASRFTVHLIFCGPYQKGAAKE